MTSAVERDSHLCLKGTGFTIQRMFIYQNAVSLPDMMYHLCKQNDHVIMLSKNQSAHSPGSHLHLTN